MNIQRRVILIALLIALRCGAAEISLQPAADEATGASGEVLSVSLASTATGPSGSLTGIQFDLSYDANALDVKVSIGPAAANAGKTITTAAAGVHGVKVIVIGFNRNPLTDGAIAVVHVSRKNGTAAGVKIRLTAPVGTTGDGTPVGVALREPERTVR